MVTIRGWAAAGMAWLVSAFVGSLQAAPQTAYRETIDRYCVTCHNQRLKTGGLTLDTVDLAQVPAQAEVWEKVVRKLQAGLMPPPGARRPDAETYHGLTSWLETQLDRAAEAKPYAGRPVLHRLNRSEYANAIRDLLALDIDAAALLPPDDSAFGFDNISEALGVSPALQEHYLSAALKIGALAVGDPNVTPGSETWRIRQDLSQNEHIEGLPLGTTGGTLVHYTFPLDGEYSFQAKLYRTNLNIMRGLETEHQVEFSVDGRRIHVATIGGKDDLASLFQKPTDTGDAVEARLRVRVPVTAGPHAVAVAFVQAPQAAEPLRLQPYLRSSVDNFDWTGHPHLQELTVSGPFHATSPGDTPSRRRIFVCRPRSTGEETACARRIISTLVRGAYRQPASQADVARVMEFYEQGRRTGNFEAGVELAVQRILASPKFVFRVERDPADAAPGSVSRVSGLELASRLSFFLWSSIPDEELLRVAAQGKLTDRAVFDRQVRRMLDDPKSEALASNFAGQWLQLRNVRNVQPNTDEFPDFDDNLRQSFRRETELLFASIVHEDRNVFDLLTADYTFINERLARHYGIPDIYGSRFRRVPVADEARRGLLGQGSILALTSHAERTSPVVRGKWILENILGMPVPPPPPDVPPLKANQEGEKPRTMREQMAEHRANAVCASCHKIMDPVGFALENFDAVGAWRSQDAGQRIDASGELADGTKVDGIAGLRKALVSRPDVFAGTLTEKLLTYALGRGLDYRDMPAVRAIVRDGARHDYRFSSILFGVVHSVPFQMRTAGAEGGA
jgi:mono/diheme cytochrome c family protein